MTASNARASSAAFFRALGDFAAAVADKAESPVHGAPEDRLRAPLEKFCREAAAALGIRVRAVGEARIPGLGRPDYAVERGGLLAGYIERKPTGTGAAASRFREHDRQQFRRFAVIPNLRYTDGAEWAPYRFGERVGRLVRLARDPATEGQKAVSKQNPESFRYDHTAGTLQVATGEFSPVAPELWDFEVSGLRVARSWLGYRMKRGAGRKSSPLDYIRPERWPGAFTTELLELLWVLEATLEAAPEQERLLTEIVSGDCLRADDLPPVPERARTPPTRQAGTLLG